MQPCLCTLRARFYTLSAVHKKYFSTVVTERHATNGQSITTTLISGADDAQRKDEASFQVRFVPRYQNMTFKPPRTRATASVGQKEASKGEQAVKRWRVFPELSDQLTRAMELNKQGDLEYLFLLFLEMMNDIYVAAYTQSGAYSTAPMKDQYYGIAKLLLETLTEYIEVIFKSTKSYDFITMKLIEEYNRAATNAEKTTQGLITLSSFSFVLSESDQEHLERLYRYVYLVRTHVMRLYTYGQYKSLRFPVPVTLLSIASSTCAHALGVESTELEPMIEMYELLIRPHLEALQNPYRTSHAHARCMLDKNRCLYCLSEHALSEGGYTYVNTYQYSILLRFFGRFQKGTDARAYEICRQLLNGIVREQYRLATEAGGVLPYRMYANLNNVVSNYVKVATDGIALRAEVYQRQVTARELEAPLVVDIMQRGLYPSIFSYNIILHAFVKYLPAKVAQEECKKIFEEAIACPGSKITPDCITFLYLLQSCRNISNPDNISENADANADLYNYYLVDYYNSYMIERFHITPSEYYLAYWLLAKRDTHRNRAGTLNYSNFNGIDNGYDEEVDLRFEMAWDMLNQIVRTKSAILHSAQDSSGAAQTSPIQFTIFPFPTFVSICLKFILMGAPVSVQGPAAKRVAIERAMEFLVRTRSLAMQFPGIYSADADMYNTILHECVKYESDETNHSSMLMKLMMEDGVAPNSITLNCLLLYVKRYRTDGTKRSGDFGFYGVYQEGNDGATQGNQDDVQRQLAVVEFVENAMSRSESAPALQLVTSVMSCYASSDINDAEKVMRLFNLLKQSWPSVYPRLDHHVFAIVYRVLGKNGRVEELMDVYAYMKTVHGLSCNDFCRNAIMAALVTKYKILYKSTLPGVDAYIREIETFARDFYASENMENRKARSEASLSIEFTKLFIKPLTRYAKQE